MYNCVREVSRDELIVCRIVNGRRVGMYMVKVDYTFHGRDWCRSHGMKLVCRVPNIEYSRWYEIWESHDRKLVSAFLI